MTDDQLREELFKAFVEGFRLEHGVSFKSMSRYPLAEENPSVIADLRSRLRVVFDEHYADQFVLDVRAREAARP